ncbi:MAG: hypothetical protein ABFS12_06945 [Bacteroidota bacterium]
MKLNRILICSFLIILSSSAITAQGKSNDLEILNRSFQLGGERSSEKQFFISETEVKTFNPDGSLATKDSYNLYLKYIPGDKTENEFYQCTRFEIQTNDSIYRTIPSLEGWIYRPYLEGSAKDTNNYVFGIDHKKFENLIDNSNNPFSPEKSYLIYNSFIDFHAFCNIIAEEKSGLKGIQDIHKIGDKVIHYASHSKPPVNLGSAIKEGSYFENGEITLELKGLSKVNEKETAIVHYDSGESSFKMIVEQMPNVIITSVGRSHYFGDIFIDLDTKWVQKIDIAEIVIAQSKLPFPPNEISAIAERHSQIINVSKVVYENKLGIN